MKLHSIPQHPLHSVPLTPYTPKEATTRVCPVRSALGFSFAYGGYRRPLCPVVVRHNRSPSYRLRPVLLLVLPSGVDTFFNGAQRSSTLTARTWFFTDTDDPHYQKLTNNHMVNTNCSQGHFRKALCCKMGKEFEFFLDSAKK
uniref:Fringe-like glycosyltransferase domain-containing protein n=1 Tax=Anopheles farauti TaxID=69004 RepID=A0A182PZH5_9DIPT